MNQSQEGKEVYLRGGGSRGGGGGGVVVVGEGEIHTRLLCN